MVLALVSCFCELKPPWNQHLVSQRPILSSIFFKPTHTSGKEPQPRSVLVIPALFFVVSQSNKWSRSCRECLIFSEIGGDLSQESHQNRLSGGKIISILKHTVALFDFFLFRTHFSFLQLWRFDSSIWVFCLYPASIDTDNKERPERFFSCDHACFSSEKRSDCFKYALCLRLLRVLVSRYLWHDIFFAFRVFKQSTTVGLTPTVCFDLKWRVGDWGEGAGALQQSLGRATGGCQRTGSPIWRRWHCKCDIPSCNINLRVNRTHNWLLNTSETLCWRQ